MRKPNQKPILGIGWLLGIILLTFQCGAPTMGIPSFTVATRDSAKTTKLEKVGPVIEEELCTKQAGIFFAWGTAAPTHAQLIQQILESKNADVILDAQLKSKVIGFPLVYFDSCVVVKGQPAKVLD